MREFLSVVKSDPLGTSATGLFKMTNKVFTGCKGLPQLGCKTPQQGCTHFSYLVSKLVGRHLLPGVNKAAPLLLEVNKAALLLDYRKMVGKNIGRSQLGAGSLYSVIKNLLGCQEHQNSEMGVGKEFLLRGCNC
jgi:hypothetical protein